MSKQFLAFFEETKEFLTLSGRTNFSLLFNPSLIIIKKEIDIINKYEKIIKIISFFKDAFFFLKGFSINFQLKNETSRIIGTI